ncbi:MAG: response regulator [Gammaproteobacteria bacterium]
MTTNSQSESNLPAETSGTSSEGLWKIALEHGSEGLWDWDTQTDVMFYSENLKRILKRDSLPNRLNAGEWAALVHPEDRPATLAALNGYLHGETPVYENEHRVQCGDGSYKWMRGFGRTIESDADGHPVRIVGTYVDIDESKAVQAALLESEHRLQRIVARIPGAVFEFVLRPDGSVGMPFVSQGFHKLFRVSADEIREDALVAYRFLEPDMLEPVLQSLHESAVGLTLWRQELPLRFPDGERRWLHGESMPELQRDGSVLWHGFISDITERKRVALALEESNARLARVTARVPGMVFEVRSKPDGSMALPYASEAIGELLGISPEDVRDDASPVFARVHPDDRPRLHETIEHSVHTLTPIKSDFRLRDDAGGERWARVDTVPTREADGSVLSYGIITDVTVIKRAEENLRREKVFVEALVLNLATPTFVLAADGTVRVWNRALEDLTGVAADEVVGTRNHSRLFYGETRPMMADIILDASIDEHIADYVTVRPIEHIPGGIYAENWATLRTGRTHYISGAAAPVYHEDGSLAAVVETLYDLTERQQLQTDLERARDDALSATRAKSSFLANMSHEIRTPLNGVIGMTALLSDTELSATQREYVDLVRSCSDQLLSLLNDVLDFSRIEAGRLEMETTDFDLWKLFEDVASALALRAQLQGLELVCFADPAVPRYLRGDPVRLRQVLLNLVGNAIKFTVEGEVELRATPGLPSDEVVRVDFTIRDTGIGIAQERLDDIFSAFVQADVSTTRQFGGSGLGLAISRQLVELMGGSLGAESSPGQGSTFTFSLDFERGTAADDDTADTARLLGVPVLVVDDNPTNRRLLEVLLERWGCRHQEVASAAEALTALRDAAAAGDPFQLALLDMHMPAMDGAALAQTIQADPAIAATKLVLLSSLGHYGDRHELNARGFVAQMSKPLRQSALHACLLDCLSSPEPDTTARRSQPAPDKRRQQLRLLLVEDNAVNQKVALGLLAKLGYRADVADNGAAAIEALQLRHYDLLLMDCHLPIMDGLAATRAIRASDTPAIDNAIPIIAMTADVLASDRQACMAAGMDDFLPKPLDPEVLAHLLQKWTAAALDGIVADADDSDTGEDFEQDFDRAVLLEHVMGDEALAEEVLAAFRSDFTQGLAELRAALEADDRQCCIRVCHTLKGTSASVGAGSLKTCAEALEAIARNGELQDLADRVVELRNGFARFNEAAAQAVASTTPREP